MRKHHYYLLFLFYGLMVIFICYVNGVFSGEVTSVSNFLINAGFLLVIGVMFAISVISFRRLEQLTDALEAAGMVMEKEYQESQECLWPHYASRKKVFEHDVLDAAFRKYQKRMASYQTRKGWKAICDLEEYINEDLVDRVALSHYNSAVSGTLTGLGILGTFLGLSLGLGAFDGNDIYTISDNVGPLLDGMKVAFHTSVYGIFFSLVFNFIYRSVMAEAYGVLGEFQERYRQCVAPTISSADENSKAMLIYQANMSNSLKQMTELLRGNAMEQTRAVERIADQFVYQMTQVLGGEFETLGRALQDASRTQEQCSRDYKSMEEAARQLQETNRAMQKSLEMLAERQDAIARNLKVQEKELAATCNMLNEELSNQLFTYGQMRDMYEK